tara:strand:+ start:1630 stop:2148 length:519 start_codon:yes stop_codon:yes gene_type:complete
MTLPAAYATISLGDINVELGRSRTSDISLDTAENGGYGTINTNSPSYPASGNPASISEWYSYNHNATPPGLPISWNTTFFPNGGIFNINKNGVRIVSVRADASGSFTAVVGDQIVITADAPLGGTRRTTRITERRNEVLVGTTNGTNSASRTFTVSAGSTSYGIEAIASNDL